MYDLRLPHPALAPYIENYWFVTSREGPVDLRVDVFVDGRADLIFNYGVAYAREVIGGATVDVASSNFDAQRRAPIRIVQRGHVHVVGVRFRLGGVGPFARQELRAFTDLTPPPAEVFGDEVIAVEHDVRDAQPDHAARRLDAFFGSRLHGTDRREPFERALATFVDADGNATVEQAARRAGISTRQVDRLFARELGIAPKTVARILRFQSTLRALMQDPGVPLAEVAANAGYFDQAHFVRDFRQMSGGVPRGYRGYYPADSRTDFAPNVVVFVQDPERASRAR